MSDNIYRDNILDLYENPLNYGELDPHDISHEEDNPLCGDVIRIDVVLDDEQRVKEIAWSGDGCAISMASASLMTEHVKGMTLEEVMALDGQNAVDLIGVKNLSMGRIKCATLALQTLKGGTAQVTENK